uniref:Uncharacterized protein n=1 Tax=Pseudopediastrum sp. CL0201VA TaxID=2184484 RepID=A0A2U8GJM4_9CHLO|nr:hypothetical protein [Pseudopediastrum sp. CL0201VA]YP_009492300.1 hypothetical protein [Pseudopediastrum sp. CL0201VA]AWI68897.1 hypothetical protein [Pseudopediastrum sp. CL0201VA]AWI68898.1 hypothetical protein [Pseudopediastrum sp. CL0201VA]
MIPSHLLSASFVFGFFRLRLRLRLRLRYGSSASLLRFGRAEEPKSRIDYKYLLNSIYGVFRNAFRQVGKSRDLTSFFILHYDRRPEGHYFQIFLTYNEIVSVKENKFKNLLENSLNPNFEQYKITMYTAGFTQKTFMAELVSTLCQGFTFLDIPGTKK